MNPAGNLKLTERNTAAFEDDYDNGNAEYDLGSITLKDRATAERLSACMQARLEKRRFGPEVTFEIDVIESQKGKFRVRCSQVLSRADLPDLGENSRRRFVSNAYAVNAAGKCRMAASVVTRRAGGVITGSIGEYFGAPKLQVSTKLHCSKGACCSVSRMCAASYVAGHWVAIVLLEIANR